HNHKQSLRANSVAARFVGRDKPAWRCVQRRLAYSVGGSPTRVRVRNPEAWIVRRKETESREPIDEAIEGWRASHRAVMNERTRSLETESQGPSFSSGGEGSMDCRRLTEAARPLWRGYSDSTMARMR